MATFRFMDFIIMQFLEETMADPAIGFEHCHVCCARCHGPAPDLSNGGSSAECSMAEAPPVLMLLVLVAGHASRGPQVETTSRLVAMAMMD